MMTIMQRVLSVGHPNTLSAVVNAQQEIGPIGATKSVKVVNPDLAIILEAKGINDMPGTSNIVTTWSNLGNALG